MIEEIRNRNKERLESALAMSPSTMPEVYMSRHAIPLMAADIDTLLGIIARVRDVTDQYTLDPPYYAAEVSDMHKIQSILNGEDIK